MTHHDALKQWLTWDTCDESRKIVLALQAAADEKTIERLFGSRMAFGTAGLRACMGPGTAQMNWLTIIQTAQGLAAYLKAQFSAADLAALGIAIGYDGRHHSQEFAQLTATAMTRSGIKTYLYDRVVPTPYVAFAIRHFKCVSGVMVTASHNPKDDNGFKVYWENGAQIIAPHDKGIAAAILANLEPQPGAWAFSQGDVSPFDEVHKAYFDSFRKQYSPVGRASADRARPEVRFTYSAMHGVGAPFTLEALAACGVPADCVNSVPEQEKPDPDFSTVAFPNPEEGKTSLDLSFRTALATNSTIVLANDPDADRLGVAERSDEDGAWHVFNGNEIGALFGWWAFHTAKLRSADLSRCHFLFSTVSSPILGSIAAKEGLQAQDTLTGFKWMGCLSEELERAGKGEVLLAFEEAIGFMWGNRVYDKDGVTAAGVMADLARYVWAEHGRTLAQQLEQVYKTYGYHFSNNSYVVAREAAAVTAMFKDISTKENGSYPTTVAGANVTGVRDLATGLDTRMPDRKATLPLSASSPIITFYMDNGATFTVRGSGTEPKLKWYSSLVTDDAAGQHQLRLFVRDAVNELIQPEKYAFKRRTEDIEASATF